MISSSKRQGLPVQRQLLPRCQRSDLPGRMPGQQHQRSLGRRSALLPVQQRGRGIGLSGRLLSWVYSTGSAAPLWGDSGQSPNCPSQTLLFKNRGDNLTQEGEILLRSEGGINDSEHVIYAPHVHTFVAIFVLLSVAHRSNHRYKIGGRDVAPDGISNGVHLIIRGTNFLAIKVQIALALKIENLIQDLKEVINLALTTINIKQVRFFDHVVSGAVADNYIPEPLNTLTKCNQDRLRRDPISETQSAQDVGFSLLGLNRKNQGEQVCFEVGGHLLGVGLVG